MKQRVSCLAAIPLALAMASLVSAGFHCGGCSDPCHQGRGHFGCGVIGRGHHVGMSYGMNVGGYSGYSVVQASPASCGAVAADGSYGMMMAPAVSSQPCVVMQTQAQVNIAPQLVCEPVTGYRTVMESTFVTETQYVTASETKQETRMRVKKVTKSIPVTFEDFRTKTVMVPTSETKTIEYSVLVPEQSTKTVDVNVTVPVWNEVSENYTVKVPVVNDAQETYHVNVPRLRDESFTYTVYVPQTESVTKMQTVTNAVPVVKTRTVQRTVASYSTQTVTKDYGHWETVVEEVAGSCYGAAQTNVYAGGCGNTAMTTSVAGGGCGSGLFAHGSSRCGRSGCGCSAPKARTCGCNAPSSNCGCGTAVRSGCGTYSSSGCGGSMIVSGSVLVGGPMGGGCGPTVVAPVSSPITTTRNVWVPSVATEEVPVVTSTVKNEEVAYTVFEQQSTQVPYECVYVVYRPETRTATKKVVEYVSEPRTRTRKVVSYNDEQRTRTRRELSYKTETKQETYPFVTYRTEKKTKEISFTVQVPTQTVEPFQSTRYETVTEDEVEEYTVNVQVPTTKEVQVQVCKMVPKLVPYTFNPCAMTSGSSTGDCGCGGSATPVFAPASGWGQPAPVAAPASGCGCGVGVAGTCSTCMR